MPQSQTARSSAHTRRYPESSKSPRARLMRLRVEADHCPEMLPRALGLFARVGVIPAAISFERKRAKLVIELHLDGMSMKDAATLLHRVQNIVSVRSVELVDGEGAPIVDDEPRAHRSKRNMLIG